jgi:glucose/mannose transport system substrate-binding protein
MKKSINCHVAGLLLAGMTAASAEREAPPPALPKLTFYHWWTSPSEAAALGALIKAFNQKYPGVAVLPTAGPAGHRIRALFPIIQRLETEKRPLDAFQMNGAYAAQLFYEAGLLSPIDDLWASEKLEQVVPVRVQEFSKFGGHYYAVPVGVHRSNVIWYNKPLLDKHKIDADSLTTWDAFFRAAETLKAAGVDSPIQVGVGWTAAIVFEGMLAGMGMKTFEDWVNGKMTAPRDPRLVKALTLLGRYLEYSNKDHATLAWDAAVRRVMNGESAFCTMGDWANGEFHIGGMSYGKDFGTLLVPGTQGSYGLNVDTFLHPRGLADDAISREWLSVVASREGQDAFNPLKGSIPARRDADISRYDPYQRAAIADLKTARFLYPSSGSSVPEAFLSQVNQTLEVFANDRDVDKAAAALAGSARTLAGKFSRAWVLQ